MITRDKDKYEERIQFHSPLRSVNSYLNAFLLDLIRINGCTIKEVSSSNKVIVIHKIFCCENKLLLECILLAAKGLSSTMQRLSEHIILCASYFLRNIKTKYKTHHKLNNW